MSRRGTRRKASQILRDDPFGEYEMLCKAVGMFNEGHSPGSILPTDALIVVDMQVYLPSTFFDLSNDWY